MCRDILYAFLSAFAYLNGKHFRQRGFFMRKILLLLLTLALTISCVGCGTQDTTGTTDVIPTPTVTPTSTPDNTADTIQVLVKISDGAGVIQLGYQTVSVTDVDQDGKYTINDALQCAHNQYYTGQGEGYSSAMTEYGLSLTTLWGDTSGSYGYYVNDASSMSLSDIIKEGDRIAAYVYRDQVGWSDVYTYFDQIQVETQERTVTLILTGRTFDYNFNVVNTPIEGATITINGTATEFVTDATGTATITFDAAGEYCISAEISDAVIVFPLCNVTIK